MNDVITIVKVENNITYYSDGTEVYEPKQKSKKEDLSTIKKLVIWLWKD